MSLDNEWIENTLANNKDLFTEYVQKFIVDSGDIKDTNLYYKIIMEFQELLKYLFIKHSDKYKSLPKGYPFYWLGFLLFKIRDYEQAIYYLDAALAEDKHYMKEESEKGKGIIGWADSGAALFFKLHEYKGKFEFFNIPELRGKLNDLITSFNHYNQEGISIDIEQDFVGRFVNKFLKIKNTAIITTLYSFIMEKADIDKMISFKSEYGGTIEPIILNLVKGSLLFESLLKVDYQDKVKQERINYGEDRNISVTLGNILSNNDFKTKMGYSGLISTTAFDINNIRAQSGTFSLVDSFTCAARIRNTSAHNLCWDDGFVKDYNLLYRHIIYSILYYIYYEYVKK